MAPKNYSGINIEEDSQPGAPQAATEGQPHENAKSADNATGVSAGDQVMHAAILSGERPVDTDGFFNPEQNSEIESAADAAAAGSGVGSYTDDGGSLLAGVERLDKLGSFQWGLQSYETPENITVGSRFQAVIGISPAPLPGAPESGISANGVHLVVNEAYLPGGSMAGQSGSQGLTHEVGFIISSNNGLYSVNINGISYRVAGGALLDFPPEGLEGSGGTLHRPVVEPLADGSYRLSFEFSLHKPYSHNGEGNDVARADDPFEITVSSNNGTTSQPIGLTVDIVDDAPQAANDVLPEVAEGGVSAYFNVLDNDQWGADQPGAKEVIRAQISDGNGGVINLTIGAATLIEGFGKVTLNADGSLVFEATVFDGGADIPGRTVTYWIADGDGDESSATVELTRDNKDNPIISIGQNGADLSVDESALASGNGVRTATGEFSVNAEAELDFVSFKIPGVQNPLVVKAGASGSVDIIEGGVNYGTFTATVGANGAVHYSFTLNSALDNDSAKPDFITGMDGDKGVFQVQATATDKIGQESSVDFNVTITDDAPSSSIVFNDNYGQNDGIVAAGSVTTGRFDMNKGADARAGEKLLVNGQEVNVDGTEITIPGYGTLAVNMDGSFKFQALANINQDHTKIEFKYIDADGDSTIQTLNVGVEKPPKPGRLELTAEVDEAGLDNIGTKAASDGEFGLINLPEGWSVVGSGDTSVGYGTIVRTENGWSFKLTESLNHTSPDGNKLSAIQPDQKPTVIVRGPDGNEYEVEVTVTIKDDGITIPDSSAAVTWHEGQQELEGIFTHDDNIALYNSNDKSQEGKALSGTFEADLSNIGVSISAGVVKYGPNGKMEIVTGQTVDGVEMKSGAVHINNSGIFVSGSFIDQAAKDKSGNWSDRFNELNYDQKTNTSEAIVIDLDGIAYGVNLMLNEFYGGRGSEIETGRITYYLKDRNGVYQEVGYTDFTSDTPDGNYSKSFGSVIGGFDRVVISATHNNISATGQDNSDFSIKSIQFDTLDNFVHYERGEAADVISGARGADGILPGSIRFSDSIDGSVIHSSLGDITLELSAENHIIGKFGNNDKAFELILTQSTGRWDFAQYVEFELQDGNGDPSDDGLKFQFQVTDQDGDTGYADIIILDDGTRTGRSLTSPDNTHDNPAELHMMEAEAARCMLEDWNQSEDDGGVDAAPLQPAALSSPGAPELGLTQTDFKNNNGVFTPEADAECGNTALNALDCGFLHDGENGLFSITVTVDGVAHNLNLGLNELTGFGGENTGGASPAALDCAYIQDDSAAMNELMLKLASSCI